MNHEHHIITHRFDDAQLDKIVNAIGGSPANEPAYVAILNKLEWLAATVQEIKDAVDGITPSTEAAIVEALKVRATALEALTPKE